jgi:hypothetical protein
MGTFIVIVRGGIGWSPLTWGRRSQHPHLHNRGVGRSLLARGRSCAGGAVYILSTRWRRSSAGGAGLHRLAWGRTGPASDQLAQGRSEPSLLILSLLIHELGMLANHGGLKQLFKQSGINQNSILKQLFKQNSILKQLVNSKTTMHCHVTVKRNMKLQIVGTTYFSVACFCL